MAERYLSVREVAERLGTTERFPRRLIEERRIEFKKFGRHVRIAETVLAAYVHMKWIKTDRELARFTEVVKAAMRGSESPGSAVTDPAPTQPDVMDQLRKLGELHAAGVLTEDEFAAKKAELFRRL
jgi:excisionase family DNA binding protein